MTIPSIYHTYFNAFSILNNKHSSIKEKRLARICIASYFLILPPLIFGIGYALSNLSNWIGKLRKKVSHDSNHNQTTIKTQEKFKEQVNSNSQELKEESKIYPEVTERVKDGFFVDVLNRSGYSIKGKIVRIPPAGRPEKFTRQGMSFKEVLDGLKTKYKINDKIKIVFQFKDRSTEEAINESEHSRIALNFANEHHAGGGPGFHKDKDTNLFIYDMPSAKAQEESICMKTTLMCSLTQLAHTLKADLGTKFIRSYYDDRFDSREMAYISLNHLFAVQNKENFYWSRYLEEPKAVAFITSAAKNYGNIATIDCSKDSDVYKDARQRIETHLLAAASRSCIVKMENPGQAVELILGAFGCGAFVPRNDPDKYREMVADIYKELLPEFQGFFDVVTFAVPTFGDKDPSHPAVANHIIFKRVLAF